MRPDAKWLDDPARAYPVTLDPDFYWQGDGSERFHGANQDCYLSGGVQAAITYCAATTLAIGYYNRPYRANLRFDLASAIPAYATITNAQLAMFLPGNTTHAAINSRVHTITSDWDNTATWNNRKTNTPWSTSGGGGDVSPAANLTGTVNPSVGNANYWYYWNTPLDTVNGWTKGTLPNYGIQVSADSEVAATNAYSFVSTDGNQASWPALDVTWVPDTYAPPAIAGLSLNSYNPAATPQVAQFDWDPAYDGDLPNGTPGSGIASTQTRYKINSNAFGPWTVAATNSLSIGNVQSGTTITVEVRATDVAGNIGASGTITSVLGSAVIDGVADRGDIGDPDGGDGDEASYTVTPDGEEDVGIEDNDDESDVEEVQTVSNGFQALSTPTNRRYTIRVKKPDPNASTNPNDPTYKATVPDPNGWASVRNRYSSISIGAVKTGQTFDSVARQQKTPGDPNQGTSDYGYVWGSYHYCGWIYFRNLTSGTDNSTDKCGGDEQLVRLQKVASLINCSVCDKGSSARLDENAYGYRNIKPWKATGEPSNKAWYFRAGERVRWRYVTSNRDWVQVIKGKIYGGSNTVFVKRSAFKFEADGARGLCRSSFGSTYTTVAADNVNHRDRSGWPPVCTNKNPTEPLPLGQQ